MQNTPQNGLDGDLAFVAYQVADQVAEAEALYARQLALVDRMSRRGQDTAEAELLLAKLGETLALMRNLKRKLEETQQRS